MSPSAPIVARIAILLCAASWGTWVLFLRAAERAGPTHAAVESTVMMAVLTVTSGVVALRERRPLPREGWPWVGVVLLGLFDAGNVISLFRAYQTTTVAVAALTHYLAPLFVTIGAPFILKERVSRRGAIGCAVSFFGLVLLLQPWRGPVSSLTGAGFGMLSAICYASNLFINKKFASSFSAASLMAWHGVVATPVLALFVPSGAWSEVTRNSLLWILAGSVSLGAVGGLVFVWGLRRVPSNVASTITFVEPLVAVLVGVAVFGEKLSALSAIGGGLVLSGAYAAAIKPPDATGS